jgi:hypothetical protein
MPRRLAILLTLVVIATGPVARAQDAPVRGAQACERNFRLCAAECGAGPPGVCVATCYQDRAQCIQNPSRPPQANRAPR